MECGLLKRGVDRLGHSWKGRAIEELLDDKRLQFSRFKWTVFDSKIIL